MGISDYNSSYRVSVQRLGWLAWAKNGETAGTLQISKRVEALQIVLVAKGGARPGNVAGISSNKVNASYTELTRTQIESAFRKVRPFYFRRDIATASFFSMSEEKTNGVYSVYGHSYTGAGASYSVDPISGEAVCLDVSIPLHTGLSKEEYKKVCEEYRNECHFNVWDYTE